MTLGKDYYAKLRKKISLIIISVSLIFLYAITWSTTGFHQKQCMKHTIDGLKIVVQNRQEVVYLFLKNQKTLLTSIMKLYTMEELSDQRNLERIFTAVASGYASGYIVDLGVIDYLGNHVAYVGPYREKLMNKNYGESEWFHDVMINGSHISDVFSGYRNVPHIVVAVADPLKKWVLRATINSEIFNALLRTAQVGATGDAFIINRKMEFQTPSRFGQKILYPSEKVILTFHEGTEVRRIKNYLYVTNWIKDGSWLLVIKVETGGVMKEFIEARKFDIFIVLFATVLIITVSTITVRWIVDKVEKVDRKRASFDSQMLQVEKMASLGRMAAGVAHEVNNPLQLITDQAGWIDELLDEEDAEKMENFTEYRQSVQKIKTHVRRASSVTHRLLGFSRKMKAEKENVDINLLLEETVSFLEKEAKDHGININLELQEELPAVMTDSSQLQQVFLNIINNALDAINKDGTVDITTRVDEETIKIDIADTGTGINKDNMKKIFDPFFTTKEPGKGTGLGLSICYSIVENLGGRIDVRNREKKGTVFTIVLPIIKYGEMAN